MKIQAFDLIWRLNNPNDANPLRRVEDLHLPGY
jgi:hypothetical protein